jgi:hypothetical protein
VAQHVFEEMMGARSKGEFYNARIKGTYPEREII